jgi:hypothetical protein
LRRPVEDAVIVTCVSLRGETGSQQQYQCCVLAKRLADITHTHPTNNPMCLILGHEPRIGKQHDWYLGYDFRVTRPPVFAFVAARLPAK